MVLYLPAGSVTLTMLPIVFVSGVAGIVGGGDVHRAAERVVGVDGPVFGAAGGVGLAGAGGANGLRFAYRNPRSVKLAPSIQETFFQEI